MMAMVRQLWGQKMIRGVALGAAVLVLGACASGPDKSGGEADEIATSAWARASNGGGDEAAAPATWQHYRLPGKQPSQFSFVRLDGRDAMAVKSEASASMLRRAVHVAPEDLGRVRFSWKVPGLIEQADMTQRDTDDAPVRVVLAFDGDRSRLSAKDAMLSEMARLLTGEEMPYATLMYVWCNKRAPGSVILNPRTDRIRKLVMESGPAKLNQWLDYERDIRADYQKAFGEPPGALIGIGIMTDTDNTRSTAKAWYGPVRLVAGRAARSAAAP